MDMNALKRFAQAARKRLIDQVRSKLDLVLDPASSTRREHSQAMKKLDATIAREGKTQVIEKVAYTWFNRFTALRFMDVNGYTTVGVVSPVEGRTRPEILAEAVAGNPPDGAPDSIVALLDGRMPSSDPQGEAYRHLLVHACNQWHGPMPFLFEELDDYTELLMPEDLLSRSSILAELREVMTEEACRDVEIIGWLYQFYISEKKDQVFADLKKNRKITVENIPAATQLFTPRWIVRYLVENSLGRLWLLNRPGSNLAERMDYYIAPEEPETDFPRITRPEDIRICDPACGSGHMLTYTFDLLHTIYEEEGYDPIKIPALILAHNLTGVEIDDRAGALAAFALAMKAAARLGWRRFPRMEAKPNIVVLRNVRFTAEDVRSVVAVVGEDLFTDELRETLGQFEQAKNFGSLIVPKLRDPAETLRVVEARDFRSDLLLKDMQARVVSMLRMAETLSPKYHVVVANPPYMGSGGMNAEMRDFGKLNYPISKTDMFSMFMERCISLGRPMSLFGMINLPSWLFLTSFSKLRELLSQTTTPLSLLHMGRGIFGIDWGSTAFVFSTSCRPDHKASFFRLHKRNFQHLHVDHIARIFLAAKAEKDFKYDFDSYGERGVVEDFEVKFSDFGERIYFESSMSEFSTISGTPFSYWLPKGLRDLFMLGSVGGSPDTKSGIVTGDNNRFLRLWHEVSLSKTNISDCSSPKYIKYNKGGYRKWYGNLEHVIDWSQPQDLMSGGRSDDPTQYESFRAGAVSWGNITSRSFCTKLLEPGILSDKNGPCAVAEAHDELLHILALTNTKAYQILASAINPTINFPIGDFAKLPFSATENLPERFGANGKSLHQLARSDWDAYEISWDFSTPPLLSPDHRAGTLEATYARLRAHWRSMTDEMRTLEEENNRIFIGAHGLQDDLMPDVPIEEITLTCNPAYRYGVKGSEGDRETRLRADTMAEFLSYAVGCMFGRYSLDAPGLILANQGERLEDYLARVPEPTFMPDEDNVIPVLDGDWFPDDITERFRQFLRVTFGEAQFRENLRYIENALGKDIRKYFTRDFYDDHMKRYKKRPIYWMFSSPNGTFNALIYMHRHRGDTVSVLLNHYLREFIGKLESERGRLEKLSDDAGASQGQRTKALNDMAVIAKQIDELNEWERDVVFPLAQAKTEIDLDDGVKVNYPKFGTALKNIPGLGGEG